MEGIYIVDIYRVDQLCSFIEWFKGSLYFLRCIHKVKNVCVLLQRIGTVQARKCLNGFYIFQLLVNEHRMKHWLIKSRLVLIGNDKHIVEVACKVEWKFIFRDSLLSSLVKFRLCVLNTLVFYLS